MVLLRNCYGDYIMLDKTEDRKIHGTKLFSIAVLASLLLLFIWHIGSTLKSERIHSRNMVFFLQASNSLGNASDYLTAEARAFSVTQDIKHLNNFWAEVEVERRRDAAIATLVALNGNEKLLTLLVESKANSDALIKTELESMRLVLEAKNVPVNQMPQSVAEYILPESARNLDAADKIKRAQKMLFDQKYYDAKAAIMGPLEVFGAMVKNDLSSDVESHIKSVATLLLLCKALAIAVAIFSYNCATAVPIKLLTKPKSRAKKK